MDEVERLIGQLKDNDAGVRCKAANALGLIKDARAVTALIELNAESKLAQESADSAKEIAMNITQQVAGSKHIADAMNSLNDTMKQISSGASQTQAGAKQLAELARELKTITGKFKLS